MRIAWGLSLPRRVDRPFAWLIACLALIGCDGPESLPGGWRPPPAWIGPAEASGRNPRTFGAGDLVAPGSFAFGGAPGFVRVSLEVEGAGGNGQIRSLNDVLFAARDDGRITVRFEKAGSGREAGRVSVRCVSGSEESLAEFEPDLWLGDPAAIVSYAVPEGEPDPEPPGTEVVLARYVARSPGREVRLAIKAVFAPEPIAPRTLVGSKPPG